ncbi:MAG: cytochrome c biogenesis protein CcsA [Solirubrobacteraceae bacterium]|nr:cytochrome c biogenesis protein CcsA [Solirubrobacteraceae bacterium]
MHGKGLRGLSVATIVVLVGAFAIAAFYAPLDADQGFRQKIFYLHVPLAIVSLVGFIVGGLLAVQHLRSRASIWDLRSYVAIHISLILGVAVLVTGAIWAKTSWGVWWLWDEPTLVSFLIVFLLYATYTPMRFAIEDPERQARYASVFAIAGGAFVPICFGAVRAQEQEVHPQTFGSGELPGPMWLTFLVSLAGMALLFATLYRFEIETKLTRGRLRALRRRLLDDDAPVQRRSAAPTI